MSDIGGVGDLVSSLLARNREDESGHGTGRMRFADAAKALLRNTVFDAASELLAAKSWTQLRMADLANAAGISRQTLYKEFGSRQGFVKAYLMREAEQFIEQVEAVVRPNADCPRTALAAAAEVFLNRVGQDPVAMAIINGEEAADDNVLSLVSTQAGPLLDLATQRLSDILLSIRPEADARSVTLFAENAVRLAISHAASPSGTARETAEKLAELLGPYIESVVGKLDVPAQATDAVTVT